MNIQDAVRKVKSKIRLKDPDVWLTTVHTAKVRHGLRSPVSRVFSLTVMHYFLLAFSNVGSFLFSWMHYFLLAVRVFLGGIDDEAVFFRQSRQHTFKHGYSSANMHKRAFEASREHC